MNQNQNKNEMQIIEPSSDSFLYSHNNYPYATDPNTVLEGRNYKEWLNKCTDNYTDALQSPEATAISKGAVSAAISISTKVLGLLGVPFAAQIGQLWTFILNALWPSDNTQWEEFMRHVEELINQRIADYARNKALAELTGLGNNLDLYIEALDDWKRNPTSQEAKTRVIDRFRIVDGLFEAYIPSFAVSGYQVQLLTVYAAAANLHLLLLRDSTIYGIDWGLSQTNVNDNYNRQIRLTATYANHCTTWYQTGLERLRGSNASSWVTYNRFRREMTLTVLDICSLFSNYDYRSYPAEVRGEITREIYTDPVGVGWVDSAPSFGEIENLAIRAPRTVTWLNSTRIFTGRLQGWSGTNNYWAAHMQNFSETNSGNIQFEGPLYGSTVGTIHRTDDYDMGNRDIYTITSQAVLGLWATGQRVLGVASARFTLRNLFNNLTQVLVYENPISSTFGSSTLTHELSGENSDRPTSSDYSHRLTSITGFRAGANGTVPVFGWTSATVDRNNIIERNKITQFPGVKSHTLNNCQVVRGTGFTGGDWLRPNNNGTFRLTITSFSSQSYRIRLRYATSVGNTSLVISSSDAGISSTTIPLTSTITSLPQTVPYQAFRVVDLPITFTTPTTQRNYTFDFRLQNPSNANVFIDRFEFVPIGGSLSEYETKHQLEKARKAVNDLFTNESKNVLKKDTTDYDIDQAANLVECVSDECANAKMILLDEVKYAKQLSEARNLLLNGNFEYQDRDGENPWKTSPNVTIQENNPIFKGRYLSMSGANNIEATNEIFPTYVYQKIDESKLKPYTRYKVRGFVGNSKDLELLVTRYDEEVDAILNVPNDIPHAPPPFCGEFDRCKPHSYPPINPECHHDVINNIEISSPCQHNKMVDNADISYRHSRLSKKHGICHESHHFEFHIDTGKIDLVENLGIWVVFKICSTDGYATLDNLEVIEEGPLGAESLERVKRREKKWKHHMEHKCSETKHAYHAAKQAVVALFTNSKYDRLKFETTISNILFADYLVQSIPYVYNKWLPGVPGMNYDIYTELKNLFTGAFNLYDQRNIIKNGDFNRGLMHWHATPHARVEQIIDNRSVLVLPNYAANVSQEVCLEHNRGYVLRVTAKKEGPGIGYVTFSDCANHIEKLTFTSCDYGTNVVPYEQSNYPTDGVPYGQHGCNIDGVPYEQSGYRTDGVPYEQSGYRTDGVPYEQSGHRTDGVPYEQSGYRTDGVPCEQHGCHTDGLPHIQHGCRTDGLPHIQHGCRTDRSRDELLGYVTKTIDVFPNTDKVRIDIGETEGTFKVESVELICMEE
uniref:Pesticidal protein n=1 Tax=Brevibacillus laterosporus TaxID=1465 RepID=U5KRN7_BRELA|nr:pesticidal protein [Brevibacillus laterosporus]